MIKYIKKNVKVIVIFIICMIITGVISAYAATVISASEVSYTSNGQTTVQGALNDLYLKATPDNMLTGKVLANVRGVCMYRKGRWYCFKINNWTTERTHIQTVFSDITCSGTGTSATRVTCSASDFVCSVSKNGKVECDDNSDGSGCTVYTEGTVECS